MAFNLVGAVAGAADPNLLNVFQPTATVAARSQFPHAVMPRNDSNAPTVNMFIDGMFPDMKYVASIVDVCPDRTTYALRCTEGPALVPTGACGTDGVVR